MVKAPAKKEKKYVQKVGPDFNWRTLQSNDEIYIVKGSGPRMSYYDSNLDQEVDECMGHYGWFKVDFVDKNGIGAWNGYGFSYLWMGPTRKLSSGRTMVAHKIGKIKLSER